MISNLQCLYTNEAKIISKMTWGVLTFDCDSLMPHLTKKNNINSIYIMPEFPLESALVKLSVMLRLP